MDKECGECKATPVTFTIASEPNDNPRKTILNLLIFPHQLFADHPGLKLKPSRVVLIEDSLFFGDPRYPMKFHKQKLWLHRATMKRYELMLQTKGLKTLYLDYNPEPDSLRGHL